MAAIAVQPYNKSIAITKSDTVNIDGSTYSASPFTKPTPCEAIWVGGAGNVVVVFEDGSTQLFGAAAGSLLPVKAIRVNSGSTTATALLALYYV